MRVNKEIAKKLLEIGAVFLRPEDPFTWASGIKSPIYCDNRLTLSFPEVRKVIEHAIAEKVTEKFPDCEMLMGTSTAGISHAAIAAYILEKPMGYVRSSEKNHGRNNKIEGKLEPGQKVVVIEDLITTGGSAIEVVIALRNAGAEVLGIVSIFSYETKKANQRLKDVGVINYSLTDFDCLAKVAADEGYIKESQIDEVIEFRDSIR
ncbi:MAG: orotate phosphoribosyltransferase [Anaerovoracaceae bacterium]